MFTTILNKILTAILAVILLVLGPGSGFADSLSVDVTSGAYLVNNEGNNPRLLLRFELPDELSGQEIVFAQMSLDLEAIISDSSALALFCHPLNLGWDLNDLGWDDLGEVPDSNVIFPEGTLFATPNSGEQEGYFDITGIVRAWADSSMTNNGMLLFESQEDLATYSYDHEPGRPFARVKFIYEPRQDGR